MLPPPQTQEFFDRVLVLEAECRQELESSVQSLSEISLLLSKTNSEVEKLANRELQMSNRLRDIARSGHLGGPPKPTGLNPLPTCQNEGY